MISIPFIILLPIDILPSTTKFKDDKYFYIKYFLRIEIKIKNEKKIIKPKKDIEIPILHQELLNEKLNTSFYYNIESKNIINHI